MMLDTVTPPPTDLTGDRWAARTVRLGPDARLDCGTVEAVARDRKVHVALSPAGAAAVAAGRGWLDDVLAAGQPVYGTSTGFGPFVKYPSGDGGGEAHGLGLVGHLGAGAGASAPAEWVRGTMLVRANALAQGQSAVSPHALGAYLALLSADLIPVVPELGSVGASGDLIPLSYAARAVGGDGQVWVRGYKRPAADALAAAGLLPCRLSGRDALALTNGTSYLTAVAALAAARGRRLLAAAERLTGWAYRTLGCTLQALDPRLHAARGHAGQAESAARIRAEATRDGGRTDGTRPLQEVYSLRCAPQVLGSCRENLTFAERIVEAEANGVSDNPVFFGTGGRGEVAHGGNFHGQQVAFAADALNAALTQTALLADRQVDVLGNPTWTGAPLLLAWEPGRFSGIAGAQICSTAIAAEMRALCQAHAVATIPTNGGNQDIVPMGALAARRAYQQTDLLARVLAVLAIALGQLNGLRELGRAPGEPAAPPPGTPPFEPFTADRPLGDDIERIAAGLLVPDGDTA
jgi:histidine ammonia-lyase/tyrosine ammonia-lyase